MCECGDILIVILLVFQMCECGRARSVSFAVYRMSEAVVFQMCECGDILLYSLCSRCVNVEIY